MARGPLRIVGLALTLAAPAPGLSATGMVTTGFGTPAAAASDVATAADGSILVVGTSLFADGTRFALARYTPDGRLDRRFGNEGKVTTDFSPSDGVASAVALDADGRVLVTGAATHVISIGGPYTRLESSFAVVRYDATGALDDGFGSGGVLVAPVGPYRSDARAVAVEGDGRIVVGGTAVTEVVPIAPFLANEYTGFGLARVTMDGDLDPTFGSGGTVVTPFPAPGANGTALAIADDGAIVVAGSNYGGGSVLARYHADGTPDATFGSAGVVWNLPDTGAVAAMVLQPDAKMVTVGSMRRGDGFVPTDMYVTRYNQDGTLDAGFGSGGVVTTIVGTSSAATAVALQADGKIVAAGSTSDGTETHFAIVRYGSDGVPDPSFGDEGRVITRFPGPSGAGRVRVAADGKLVVAGSVSGQQTSAGPVSRFALARYETDGSLDSSFGGEECGDCEDNDGDGLVDFEDPECCAGGDGAPPSIGAISIRRRPTTTRLSFKARLVGGAVRPPGDFFIQLRQEPAGERFCARLPADALQVHGNRAVFRDRSGTVASAAGLQRVLFSRRRRTLVAEGRGRAVHAAATQPGTLGVILVFDSPGARCESAVVALRQTARGLRYP